VKEYHRGTFIKSERKPVLHHCQKRKNTTGAPLATEAKVLIFRQQLCAAEILTGHAALWKV